jgi:hypothetical protein
VGQRGGIHLAMGAHDRVMRVDFSATKSQITNQFFAAFELRARRLIAIKIADQTNAKRDVVQVIAMHMPHASLKSKPTVFFGKLDGFKPSSLEGDFGIRSLSFSYFGN